MAKEFLARILTIENSVASNGDQDCIICQEKCGTLSSETGIMELEVRLPCNHTVGSACIARWLANNNTCPLCRREFFPRQPHPYMEHGLVEDTEDEELIRVQRLQGEVDWEYLSRLSRSSESNDSPHAFALRYSEELDLPLPIAFLALNIADTADTLDPLEVYSVMAIAGASVYIASHLLNRPKSLAETARLANVSERTIHNIYRIIYSYRYVLVDEDWRRVIGGAATLGEAAEALPSLTFPPLEVTFSDSEGEGEEPMDVDVNSGPLGLGGLGLVQELCSEFRQDDNPNSRIWTMAQQVAERMEGIAVNWATVNPWTIAAACTLMASHLALEGETLEEVSAVSGINPAMIRDTYEVMYSFREQIVQDDWFQAVFWTRSSALYCLPEPFEL